MKQNWEQIPLIKICRPKQWKTISTEELLGDGYPVYGANGKIGFYSEYNHEVPTILVTCRGATCGTVNICESKSYVTGNAMSFGNLESKKVDLKYLYHFLRSRGFKDVISGSAQPQITKQGLDKIKIPLPPLPEQRRIAAILDKADLLRRKRAETIKLLDQFLRSVFLDMFGDLRKNPKQYPLSLLGSICDVRDGTHDSPKYVGAGYPLVTSKNVVGGFIDLSEVNYITDEDYEKINRRSKVDKGDILMPMIGTIGNPVLVEEKPAFAIKNVALIKFKKTSPSRFFVHYLLSSYYFDFAIKTINRGGTQKFVALGDIRNLPMPLPNVDEINGFERFFLKVTKLKNNLRTSVGEGNCLFNSLTQRAFRGEL